MTPAEYQALAEKTEAKNFEAMAARLADPSLIRLLHAGVGLATEAGEFQNALKKAIFYGKPVDKVNLAEEVGDVMWYVALACNELDVDLESVMKTNIDKLQARYPNKFTETDALNRNLEVERAILEK